MFVQFFPRKLKRNSAVVVVELATERRSSFWRVWLRLLCVLDISLRTSSTTGTEFFFFNDVFMIEFPATAKEQQWEEEEKERRGDKEAQRIAQFAHHVETHCVRYSSPLKAGNLTKPIWKKKSCHAFSCPHIHKDAECLSRDVFFRMRKASATTSKKGGEIEEQRTQRKNGLPLAWHICFYSRYLATVYIVFFVLVLILLLF